MRGAEAMLSEYVDHGTPYTNEGRGGSTLGGSWPQGKPGPLPTSVSGLIAEHVLLGQAYDLLMEVARAPKAYRGLKSGGGGSVRYTAVELSDDLLLRIHNAVVVPAPSNLTEQFNPGDKVVSTVIGRVGRRATLIRKVLGTTVDAWFVKTDDCGGETWVQGTFEVAA